MASECELSSLFYFFARWSIELIPEYWLHASFINLHKIPHIPTVWLTINLMALVDA